MEIELRKNYSTMFYLQCSTVHGSNFDPCFLYSTKCAGKTITNQGDDIRVVKPGGESIEKGKVKLSDAVWFNCHHVTPLQLHK
jgi:hypothetical protein